MVDDDDESQPFDVINASLVNTFDFEVREVN